MTTDFTTAGWLNQPASSVITRQTVTITTDPHTDFWQRSYYGFRNDNAPALLLERNDNFTFTARARFAYRKLFDQCGLIIYLDSGNWFKASIEYDNERFSRLGSVVTNNGYSDWATTDIATTGTMWYRISRRGPDFLREAAPDGSAFRQMRIFHLHTLGETTAEMGKLDPFVGTERPIRFGVYACSPLDSSFAAEFDHFSIDRCEWPAHGTEGS
jgi:regulation of enolase protein 1 (concanavalin A-like superfamily)